MYVVYKIGYIRSMSLVCAVGFESYDSYQGFGKAATSMSLWKYTIWIKAARSMSLRSFLLNSKNANC